MYSAPEKSLVMESRHKDGVGGHRPDIDEMKISPTGRYILNNSQEKRELEVLFFY